MDKTVVDLFVGRFNRLDREVGEIKKVVVSHDKDIVFVRRVAKGIAWILLGGASIIGFGEEVRAWLGW